MGIALLAAAGLILWWGVTALFSTLSGMESPVAAALIAAVATVLTIAATVYRDRAKSRQEVHREKKVETYSPFFDLIFTLVKNSSSEDAKNHLESADFADTLFDLKRGAMFYGSPAVVKSLSAWNMRANSNPSPYETFGLIGDVLMAMRSDIGLSNNGLDRYSIHQIYINDDVHKMKDLSSR